MKLYTAELAVWILIYLASPKSNETVPYYILLLLAIICLAIKLKKKSETGGAVEIFYLFMFSVNCLKIMCL